MRAHRRPILLVLVALAAAAAAVLVVRACAEPDPRELLGRLKPASSGIVRFDADVALSGLAALAGPVRLTLEGPFVDPRPGTPPQLDLDALAVAPGQRVDGGLVLTADRTFIRYQKRAYVLDAAADRSARATYASVSEALPPFLRRVHIGPFDPGPRAEITGEEEAGGETLTRVEGPLDPGAVVAALARILAGERQRDGSIPALTPEQVRQAAAAVRDPRWAVAVADDDTVRRAELTALIELPPEVRERLGGIAGGTLTLTLAYRDLGRPQQIEPPSDPLPAERLERELRKLAPGGPPPAGR